MRTALSRISKKTAKNWVTWLQWYWQFKSEQTKLVKTHTHKKRKKREETFSEFAVHKTFHSDVASFFKDKLCSRRYAGKPQFSSTAGLGNEMKLKSRLPPFSSVCIWCLIYIDSMTRHTGSFQILFLGSCPLLTDWKISLISLARYAISGQIWRLSLLSDTISLGLGFKLLFFGKVFEFRSQTGHSWL